MKNRTRYIIATEVTEESVYDDDDLFGPDLDKDAVDKENGMFFTDEGLAKRVCQRLNSEAEDTRFSGRWPTDIPNYLVRKYREYEDPAWPNPEGRKKAEHQNGYKLRAAKKST